MYNGRQVRRSAWEGYAMYKSFRVKNFRCFKDLQINDLGRVNLIAGKNNTGKTALLEAMYWHTRPFQPELPLHLQQIRGLETPERGLRAYWQLLFRQASPRQHIVLNGEKNNHHHTLEVFEARQPNSDAGYFAHYTDYLIQLGRPKDEAVRLTAKMQAALIIYFQSSEKGNQYTVLYPDGITYTEEDAPVASKFIPVKGNPAKDLEIEKYSQIVIKDRLAQLVESLRTIEPQLNDLRQLSAYGDQMLWADAGMGHVPLNLMGDGVNRVCHFLLTMMADEPSYFFIDEIENGIHHSVQKGIWKAIGQAARELDIQVFAITHSLEMIRAAYEAFAEDNKLDEFRYHRLDRDEEGQIEAVTYNEPALDAIASFDFDFEVRG